jgi:hypothetical protein
MTCPVCQHAITPAAWPTHLATHLETCSATELAVAARSATADAGYCAWALTRYQAAHQLDDPALAAWLGCPLTALPRLALSLRPVPTAADFADQVSRRALVAGCSTVRLGSLLRETAAALGG